MRVPVYWAVQTTATMTMVSRYARTSSSYNITKKDAGQTEATKSYLSSNISKKSDKRVVIFPQKSSNISTETRPKGAWYCKTCIYNEEANLTF